MISLIRRGVRDVRSRLAPIKRSFVDRSLVERGRNYQFHWRRIGDQSNGGLDNNPLRNFFYSRTEGRGIWKWDHYFDIYDRHFSRFRGTEVHILEIGVYSGGSLDMWHEYFGPRAHVYGVDIQPDCASYADDKTTIFVGDQSDPHLWERVRREAPRIDIIIDDGSHLFEHQIATLQEMLPHLQDGGVFLCEDVIDSKLTTYVAGLCHRLNDNSLFQNNFDQDDRRIESPPNAFQARINSIHIYPFVTVLEVNQHPVHKFLAPKRGTKWEPFLK